VRSRAPAIPCTPAPFRRSAQRIEPDESRLLKQEQERIADALFQIGSKLEASNTRFDDNGAKLRMALDLTIDCALAYRTAPDQIKKQFNQVFFSRVLVHADSSITPGFAEPFNTLLNPGLRAT
jgi:hypothetical protein